MADYKKVLCVYHPDQFITNFCNQKICLMPLCPSCIGTHSEYHDKNGFKATYYNINDVLTDTQSKILNLILVMEEDKKRNVIQNVSQSLLLNEIYNLPNFVREKILIAKKQAYAAIDIALEQLQKEIILIMQKRHDQVGIYSLSQVQQQQKQLTDALKQLDDMQHMLKSDKCLASVIKFSSESQKQITNLHHHINNNLNINQNYQPFVEINQSIVPNIKSFISKFIKLQFNFPVNNKNLDKIYNEPSKRNLMEVGPEFNNRLTKTISNSQVKRGAPANFTPSKTMKPTQSSVPIIIQENQFQTTYSPIKKPNRPQTQIQLSNNGSKKFSKYDEQFETLSKRLQEMRKENEALTKVLKKN